MEGQRQLLGSCLKYPSERRSHILTCRRRLKKDQFSQGENQESCFGHSECKMAISYSSREVLTGIGLSKLTAQWIGQGWL